MPKNLIALMIALSLSVAFATGQVVDCRGDLDNNSVIDENDMALLSGILQEIASTGSQGGSCGDGVCDKTESSDSCLEDCPTTVPNCGDGKCNGNEDPNNCPLDCVR